MNLIKKAFIIVLLFTSFIYISNQVNAKDPLINAKNNFTEEFSTTISEAIATENGSKISNDKNIEYFKGE